METEDIFERLKKGNVILPDDPQAHRMRDASFATKKSLAQMNSTGDPKEIRNLLSKITGSQIDQSVTVFTPLHINYGKHLKIGKNVFINFDCVFLDLGGITIEDNVLIAPKVSLLSEGHPISPADRQSLVPGHIHIKKKCMDRGKRDNTSGCNHWRECSSSSWGSCFKRRS